MFFWRKLGFGGDDTGGGLQGRQRSLSYPGPESGSNETLSSEVGFGSARGRAGGGVRAGERVSGPVNPSGGNRPHEGATCYQQRPKLLRTIGRKGSKRGQLSMPCGVAVTRQGDIVVADTENSRLQVFTPCGQLRHIIGSQGDQVCRLNHPMDVALTYATGSQPQEEHVLVTDSVSACVKVFRLNGTFVDVFCRGDNTFDLPYGIAVSNNPERFIVVTDICRHCVTVLTSSGRRKIQFGKFGDGIRDLDHPYYVAVTSGNDIAVSNSGNTSVKIFDQGGNILQIFTQDDFKLLDEDFVLLQGITTDGDGNVLLVGNSSVYIMANDGRLWEVLVPRDNCHSPKCVAYSPDGTLVVTQADLGYRHEISVFRYPMENYRALRDVPRAAHVDVRTGKRPSHSPRPVMTSSYSEGSGVVVPTVKASRLATHLQQLKLQSAHVTAPGSRSSPRRRSCTDHPEMVHYIAMPESRSVRSASVPDARLPQQVLPTHQQREPPLTRTQHKRLSYPPARSTGHPLGFGGRPRRGPWRSNSLTLPHSKGPLVPLKGSSRKVLLEQYPDSMPTHRRLELDTAPPTELGRQPAAERLLPRSEVREGMMVVNVLHDCRTLETIPQSPPLRLKSSSTTKGHAQHQPPASKSAKECTHPEDATPPRGSDHKTEGKMSKEHLQGASDKDECPTKGAAKFRSNTRKMVASC